MSNSEKIACSVPLLTLNSSKTLKKCLESIKDFDDIIIVDGGSSDNTLEIAKEYGARVYFQNEDTKVPVQITDFTAMRKKAWNYAKNDWILDLDSNEWLDKKLIEEIEVAVNENNPNKIYFARRVNVVDGKIIKHAFYYPKFYPRLVNKKSGVYWEDGQRVHERLFIPPTAIPVYFEGVIYKPSSSSKTEFLKKKKYYIDLELKERAPAQKTWYQFFYWVLYRNFRTILGIVFKTILIYLRHGFEESLPPEMVWFYIDYHLTLMFKEAELILKEKLRIL